MSEAGQTQKNSVSANVFRITPDSGHRSMQSACLINLSDYDVRSLAGPEPDRKVFAKFKHLLRMAAARSAETIRVTISEILRAFTPTECANYFRNSGDAQS